MLVWLIEKFYFDQVLWKLKPGAFVTFISGDGRLGKVDQLSCQEQLESLQIKPGWRHWIDNKAVENYQETKSRKKMKMGR